MAKINKFLNFSQKNPLLAKNVPLFVANLKYFLYLCKRFSRKRKVINP